MHVPPLPARECDRLLYPTGPIDGVWTGLELRYAETLGVKIESVLYAYAWDNAYPILRPFAARGWSIRADNAATGDPGDAAFAAWVKWFLNSLTGKTGQLPDHETLVFVPAIDGPPILDKDAEIVGESDYGAWVIVRSRRVDACAHVEWAAHLTAEARIELHRQLLHAGDGVLYCDTDSVYSTRALTRRVGPGLGEWGHEGSLSDWTCLAPKVYRYYDPDTGKVNVRGKGMSDLNSAGFDTLAAGGKWIVDRGVDGLKTALRSHSSELFRRKHLSRSLTPFPGWIGGRVLHGAGTRAPTVAEYRARKT